MAAAEIIQTVHAAKKLKLSTPSQTAESRYTSRSAKFEWRNPRIVVPTKVKINANETNCHAGIAVVPEKWFQVAHTNQFAANKMAGITTRRKVIRLLVNLESLLRESALPESVFIAFSIVTGGVCI